VSANRPRPNRRRRSTDRNVSIGILLVCVPYFVLLSWLLSSPLRHQREAVAGGLILYGLIDFSAVLLRSGTPVADKRESNTRGALEFVVVLLSVLSALLIIPVVTGERFWAVPLGLFAGFGAKMTIAAARELILRPDRSGNWRP
jgi:hypothetical protein